MSFRSADYIKSFNSKMWNTSLNSWIVSAQLGTTFNYCNHSNWVKPDKNDLPNLRSPQGMRTILPVDGVTQNDHLGEVFKSATGMETLFHIVITGEGVRHSEPSGDVSNTWKGVGWENMDFLLSLIKQKSPDHGWDEIFVHNLIPEKW